MFTELLLRKLFTFYIEVGVAMDHWLLIYYHTKFYGPTVSGASIAPTMKICTAAMLVLFIYLFVVYLMTLF
jgi:hypothetical protein